MQTSLITNPQSLSSLLDAYDSTVRSLLDKHALLLPKHLLATVPPSLGSLTVFVLLALLVAVLNPSTGPLTTGPLIPTQITPFSSASAIDITSLFSQPKSILLIHGQIFGRQSSASMEHHK